MVINKKDILISINPNGSLSLSCFYMGYLVTRVYYFYSKEEALSLFLDYIKELGK